MSGALTLDDSQARWLAGLDPTLGLLPQALPATSVSSWRLHDVRWEPARGCRLAYRVEPRGSTATFVAVDVTGTDWHEKDFREDDHIRGLRPAADPGWVAARLGPAFAEQIQACGVEPVRYRPGSHCVLRYDVRTASGNRTFYGKVFGDGSTDAVAKTTSLAGSSVGARLVPAVTASWPDVHVTVGAGVPGRAVSSILGGPGVTTEERARLAYRLGDLLARFHGIHDVDAPSWSAADQVTSLAQAIEPVRFADAPLGDRFCAVLDLLAGSPPAPTSEVLGHGGFRAGQVILSGQDLVVLDTDGLCRCDPCRDLGNALAHLRWHGVRHPDQQLVLRDAERALLSGYEARAGTVDPDSLAWWRAVGLLQVGARRYRRLELADWPSVPNLVDAAADLLLGRQARTAPGGATNLVDPRQMTTVLRLGLPSATSPRTLEVESAEQVASAPGRRAVVRYRVRGLAGEEPVTVVGKTFTEAWRARLLHEHLRLLHDGPFGHDGLRVPEPLGLLPEQRLVLYRHVPGTPLDEVTEPARTEDGVRRAAHWLARLHTAPVRLPRRLSLTAEEDATLQWAVVIGRLRPELAEAAGRLAEAWAEAARTACGGDEVPIHKDFHPGHVLIGEDTCVVDLDEARQGDPAFDVAHFCAYLDLAAGAGTDPLRSRFVQEYVAGTGWRDRGSFRPFLAYTWLKIAKQWAVGSGPGRRVSPARRAVGAEQALRRGLRCLTE